MLILSRIAFVLLCSFAAFALFRQEPWAVLETMRNSDKLAHFALFFALACSSGFVFAAVHPLVTQFPLFLLAGVSEWFQAAYLPQRHFSMGDIGADVIGILLGFLFCFFYRRRNRCFQ
jgi:VanZ family protein